MRIDHVLRGGRRGQPIASATHDGADIDARQGEPHLARDDARHVEHVRHDLDLCPRVAFDDVDGVVPHRLVVGMDPEELDPPEHRVEGRAELMRQGGEKVVLDSPCPLGLVGEARGLSFQLSDPLVGGVISAPREPEAARQGGGGDENV